MYPTVDLRGKYYEFRVCTLDDIKPHFDMVEKFVPLYEHDSFIERMRAAIELKTAFVLADNSCFLYYINKHPCCAEGVAMFGKKVPMKMLALMSGIFRDIDKDTFKIDFNLHPEKFLQEYKSMLTSTSIKRHIDKRYPLVVRVDDFRNKINKLVKKGL